LNDGADEASLDTSPQVKEPAMAETPSTSAPKPDRLEAVFAAVRDIGAGTAAAVAAHAGMAYSSVTPYLRKLDEAGRAHPERDANGKLVWRIISPTEDTPTSDFAAAPQADDETARTTPADTSPPTPAPHDTVDDVAAPDDADSVPGGSTPSADGPPAQERTRRKKGEIPAAVLAVLRADPGQALSPHQLGKILTGMSVGAIANACSRLTHDGSAVLVQDKPTRYQAS
jgi:hypothetical protein